MTGQELKILRLNAGLTQKELAEKLGVWHDRITKWETGKHKISNSYSVLLEMFFSKLK